MAILGPDKGQGRSEDKPWISREKGVNKPGALAGELNSNTCISFLNATHQ